MIEYVQKAIGGNKVQTLLYLVRTVKDSRALTMQQYFIFLKTNVYCF